MRPVAAIVASVITVTTLCTSATHAAFFGLPRVLENQIERMGIATKISFDVPVLPPIGHSRFCLEYPDDCTAHAVDFRRRQVALTAERWDELNTVNRDVNHAITPEVIQGSGATDEWVISPPAGDCVDYAVTKRHELLARGWPSRALLLSEVIVPDGEHHLVLVVRTKDADLVLDNLNANIRPAPLTYRQYQWVRIEIPQNPKLWARVRMPGAMQTAMLSN
jgi:predicted transglutaminase-like cysteine proteinase